MPVKVSPPDAKEYLRNPLPASMLMYRSLIYTAWFKKPVHTARFKTRFEFAHLSQARSSSHVRLAYAEPSRG